MSAPHQPQITSPELGRFLESHRLRKLRGQELQQRIHDIFGEDVQRRPLPEELLPHRILVMWRIARATAMMKGLCEDEELLEEATDVSPDPWILPFLPTSTGGRGEAMVRRGTASKLLVLHAEGDGLPLLPPRHDRAALERWCQAAGLVAKDLGIDRHQTGLVGLEGVLLPEEAEKCDVTSEQVIALEDLMVTEAFSMLLDHGERATLEHYREEYGLSRKEAVGMLRLVKARARHMTMGSMEEKRAMQEARLENFISRAKEGMNMDDEMKALKELAKVQGLTRSEPESAAMEIADVIRRVSARQDAELEARIEGARTVDVEVSVPTAAPPARLIREQEDPLDIEALQEYDRENQHR